MRTTGGPFIAVAVTVLLWSTAYAASGLALHTMSAGVMSVLRFAIALVVLVPLALRRQPDGRPTLAQTLRQPRTILLAITGVTLYYLPANAGLLFTTPGTSALLAAATPILTAAFAVWLVRERLGPRVVIGLLLATVGVVLVAAEGFQFNIGVILVLAGLVSYALYTVLLRKFAEPAVGLGPEPPVETGAITLEPPAPRSPTATVLATATAIWGTLFMLPWPAIEVATGTASWPHEATGWAAILYLALIVTGPTMVMFNYGAERLPAAVSGIAVAGIPVFGYLVAVILGEQFNWVKGVGGLVALVGIVIATMPARRGAGASAAARAPTTGA